MSYLGQGLGLGREERFTATATAGQTTVSVGDDGRSISYTPNYVDVYLNGSKQVNGSDITVTSGTSIVFASALTAGDVVDVVAPGYFQPADTVSRSLGGTFLGPVNLPSGGLNVGSGQLQVDSSGRVRMNSQPNFLASLNSNYTLSSGWAKFPTGLFTRVIHNVGSHFSTSTNRFTAPVAGMYLFYGGMASDGGASASSYLGYEFYVNGARKWDGWNYKVAGYQKEQNMRIFQLAAGDYVEPGYESATTFTALGGASNDNPYTRFGGYLLG